MTRHPKLHGRLAVLTAALLLAACSGDNPDTLLASARDYLAKNDAKAAVIQVKNVLQKAPNSAEARLLLGKALLASGDPVGAEVELRKAMDAKYAPDQVVPLLAQALLATGHGSKVLDELEKVELSAPGAKADLQTSVALAQASLGKMAKARQSIDAALALKPDHVPTMVIKAKLLLIDRDVDGALALVESILAKDPKSYEALKLKGDILSGKDNVDGAVAAYRQAIAAEPNFLPAHAALMASLLKQGKFADAATALDVMKKVAPKNPQTQLVEGQLHYQKKEFKQARDSVQEVLKVLPQYPPALVLAGAVNYQLNSLLEAEDFLSRAVKLSPELTMARRMLAAIYLRTSRPAKALALIEPVLDNADNDGDLLSLAGEIYMQNGKPQKAEEYFSKAAVLDPKNANKQTRVALTHFVEGKADIAYGELERIADADTGTTADMALIAAAIKQKDFGKAMKAIDALEKKQADNPLVYALRGTVLVAKGDTAGGRKSFEKALAVKPGYYPAAASLAGLDLADKKPDDAKKRFEGILSVDGKNLQALMALAELKARTGGSVDEVAAQLGKAMAANPDEQAPRLALVNLYLGNKDFKKALTVAQDAAAAMPDKVAILDALARAQQSTGDTNQALATYGKIASLMPASPQVFLRMAEINVAAKNNEAAIQSLRKALELKPDLIAAQRGLIMLYLESKNVPDAERVARDVKQQRPKEAVGFLFEGDIAAARKAWPEALAAYRAGLRQVPSTELAVKIYGALYAAGNAAEAEKFAAGWLVDHPRDAAFRSALAENAIARKEFATAIRQYQVLLQAQPNNPLILNNIAWTLGQLNDPKALDYAERALRIAPNQPAIMETAATLLVQKGDNARALDLMQKAMSLAPQAATLKLSLARVQIKAGKKADAQKNLEELAKLGEKFPAQAEVAKLQKEIAN